MQNQILNEVFGPSNLADRVATAEIAHARVHDPVKQVHDDEAEGKVKECHCGVGLVSRRNSRAMSEEVVDRRACHLVDCQVARRVDHPDVAVEVEET